MSEKAKWITRSAAAIALIIVAQIATAGLGQQLLTGSLVNLILALAALLFGWSVGSVAAVVSPFMAYLLGINAQILVVPAIAVGNLTYVLVIALLSKALEGKGMAEFPSSLIAVIAAAVCKFAIQYLLIVKWIAPTFLPAKALPVIAVNFGVMQLFTACIGGVLACLARSAVGKGIKSRN
jgi:hypothetical protein